MEDDYRHFQEWYVDILSDLFEDTNAGFVILMVTFPLLERYIRNRAGVSQDDHFDDRCCQQIQKIFPSLQTLDAARKFWKVFRHGLLHQVTLKRTEMVKQRGPCPAESVEHRPLPEGCLRHDLKTAITIDGRGTFLINPVLFSKKILAIIDADFDTYASRKSTTLPQVKGYPSFTYPGGIALGTSTE